MKTVARTALIAAAAIITAAVGLPTVAAAETPMVTAGYNPSTGMICVRTRAANLNPMIAVRIRPGKCRTAAEWQRAGVNFATPTAAELAATPTLRQPGRAPIVQTAVSAPAVPATGS